MTKTVTDAMENMKREQEKILNATERFEQEIADDSSWRISLLNKLLESEIHMKRESDDIRCVRKCDLSNGGMKVRDIMNVQNDCIFASLSELHELEKL